MSDSAITFPKMTPYHGSLHYTNPDSQGKLIKETKNFPLKLPRDCKVYDAYSDRMMHWDQEKWREACSVFVGKSGLTHSIQNHPDETLIEFASIYTGKEVVAVRWLFHFNVASGYDCPCMIAIYKKESE